jgi:hypothetical protein
MKKCSKCKIEKAPNEFTGKNYYCNQCQKEYYLKWLDKNNNKVKEWKEKNKEKISTKEKEWRIDNKEKFNAYHNNYHKQRRKDPLRKLHKFIAAGVYRGIKFGSKDTSSLDIVGTNSWGKLKQYIESKFTDGMNWNNYGKGKNNETWHIDHIIPISSATTLEEVKKLNHYTNLRPMWCSDNIRKSNK